MKASTRYLLPAAAMLMAFACDAPTDAPSETALEPSSQTLETSMPAAAEPIPGWGAQPDNAPALVPADLSLATSDGASLSSEDLRGQWTIVTFWGLWSEDSIADLRFMKALDRAIDQDPELNFAAIHVPQPGNEIEAPYGAYLSLTQGLADQGAPFPTVEDANGTASSMLGITSTPTYLLVGPDLAIEAQRGAIAPDEIDGIKSMLQGVAEIKKQIVVSP